MTASKVKATVKIGMKYEKNYNWLKILKTSNMKKKNQFQGCC